LRSQQVCLQYMLTDISANCFWVWLMRFHFAFVLSPVD
jgi:hypothetical protein